MSCGIGPLRSGGGLFFGLRFDNVHIWLLSATNSHDSDSSRQNSNGCYQHTVRFFFPLADLGPCIAERPLFVLKWLLDHWLTGLLENAWLQHRRYDWNKRRPVIPVHVELGLDTHELVVWWRSKWLLELILLVFIRFHEVLSKIIGFVF